MAEQEFGLTMTRHKQTEEKQEWQNWARDDGESNPAANKTEVTTLVSACFQ